MAGAGAKKFPAFSKLTSNDVNNYLADQVVMRFATTTARDAAFGGVGEPTLAEGMCAYIDADNSIYTYDGSNWVKVVSTSTPNGLVLVGSGTFSSASFFEITGMSDEFYQYKAIWSCTATAAINMNAALYNGATIRNSQYYSGNGYAGYDGTSGQQNPSNNATSFYVGTATTAYRAMTTLDFRRKSGEQFVFVSQLFDANTFRGVFGGGFRNATDAFDRIRVTTSSGFFTGDWALYGYRNS